jgi:peptide chain release factor 1
MAEAKALMAAGDDDDDMLALAKEEYKDGESKIGELEEQLKVALLPQDPNDDKNVYIEIRPAAGGNESSLFSQELLRAYMMFSQAQ